MVQVSQEIGNQFYSFNSTLFKLNLKDKAFVNEVVSLGGEELIGLIYEKGDIKFSSALINTGMSFSPNKLFWGLYSRNYTTFKAHLTEIRDNISSSDYSVSNDILDAMYSNNYVRNYNSFNCFYPPSILANITKTNRKEYNEKIYQVYKNLYDNGSTTIKDVLDTCAIVALNSPNISIVAPISGRSSFKHNLYLNVGTQTELKLACLLMFSNFNDLEIGRAIHELTHLSSYYIFKNHANPYSLTNDSQQQKYNYAAKQMISNITSLMKVDFSPADIENTSITTLKFKNDLLSKRDIVLYSAIGRLDEPTMLDLFSRIFFNISMGSDSKEKYIKILYQAEITSKNTSKTAEIALERFGNWAYYTNDEVDVECIARFVELHYRFKKLNYSQDSLQSMITYWLNNISPKVAELKTSLNLSDCAGNETFIFDYDEGDQSISSYQDNLSGVAGAIALVGITCVIGYLAANFPFPHHPMVECEW